MVNYTGSAADFTSFGNNNNRYSVPLNPLVPQLPDPTAGFRGMMGGAAEPQPSIGPSDFSFQRPSARPTSQSFLDSLTNGFGVSGSDALSNGLTSAISGTPQSPVNNLVAQAAGTTAAPTTPGAEGNWLQKTFMDGEGGLNMDGLESITKILGTVGSLYGAFQQQKLARDQFNFSKETFDANLNNQRKSYNTALEGRTNARYAMEGKSSEEANEYFRKNKL